MDWKFEKIVLPLQADGLLGPDRIGSDVGQNALLKTLEEPPAGTVIILVTTREDRLLPDPEPLPAGRIRDRSTKPRCADG